MNKSSRVNIRTIFAYIIGFLVCQNVMYFSKVGNSYINIIYIFTLCIMCLRGPGNCERSLAYLNKWTKCFFFIILLSFFTGAIYNIVGVFASISVYFKGLISLFLGLSVYISVILLKDYKTELVRGLWHGFVINVIVSALQYIFFQNGSYFSLYRIFPQESFQVCTNWAIGQSGEVGTSAIFFYRASGMFLETSYYLCYSAVMLCPLCVLAEKTMIKYFVIVAFYFFALCSASGNILVLIALPIVWLTLKNRMKIEIISLKTNRKNIITILLFVLIGILVIQQIVTKIDWSVFNKMLNVGVQTAKLSDEGNVTRFSTMLTAFSLIFKYPLGVGYNYSPMLLLQENGRAAVFNYFATISLELSVVGLIVYLLSYISRIRKLFKCRTKLSMALVLSLFSILIFQFGNGIGLTSYIWVILALCDLELKTLRNNNTVVKEEIYERKIY